MRIQIYRAQAKTTSESKAYKTAAAEAGGETAAVKAQVEADPDVEV